MEDRASERIVARVTVFVFSDDPEQLRAAVPDFREEVMHWSLTNPRVSWDATMERLVLDVDMTSEDRDHFGLEGYAELVADQAYKITCATVADLGEGGVRILGIHPV